MSKRFTDTEKWKKPFIRSLQAPYKLLWFYILDDCDHAGIWQVDIEVANIRIGEQIELEDAKKIFGDKIVEFHNNEKWFIQDFIDFQYGELNPDNRVHNSVIKQLSKYKLTLNKTLISPLQGAKDKEQDKDKDKDKDKGFEDFWNEYDKKIDRPKSELKWNKLNPKDKDDIMLYVPKYKDAVPEKQYRKDPCTFLNNRSWENEIIEYTGDEKQGGIPHRPNDKYLEGKSHDQKKRAWTVWRNNGWEYLDERKGWVEKKIKGTESIGNMET